MNKTSHFAKAFLSLNTDMKGPAEKYNCIHELISNADTQAIQWRRDRENGIPYERPKGACGKYKGNDIRFEFALSLLS